MNKNSNYFSSEILLLFIDYDIGINSQKKRFNCDINEYI